MIFISVRGDDVDGYVSRVFSSAVRDDVRLDLFDAPAQVVQSSGQVGVHGERSCQDLRVSGLLR